MMSHNAGLPAESSERINLAGIALGNACVNDKIQIDSPAYLQYLSMSNLVPPNTRPFVASAPRAMSSWLGYTPNFYDYRVKKVQCSVCYDFDYGPRQEFLSRSDVQSALNVCPGSGDDAFTGKVGRRRRRARDAAGTQRPPAGRRLHLDALLRPLGRTE